ncbi:MAG TPA: DUF2630 family protein [Mycobacteriales bacterium]|jgi:hypothetical protein|nr:DUF2630 family protein [Mycobacteriales bacterium]
MEDKDILQRIRLLVGEEHQLRSRYAEGSPLSDDELLRLQDLEERLDLCWDLLRQRRARREWGQDPESAHERPVREVEAYLQ